MNAYERTPKPANMPGAYFDLNNRYKNNIKFSPTNTPGIAVTEIYELRNNPTRACIFSGSDTAEEACPFRMSKAIKCPSAITAEGYEEDE